jgi:hypothetical protein
MPLEFVGGEVKLLLDFTGTTVVATDEVPPGATKLEFASLVLLGTVTGTTVSLDIDPVEGDMVDEDVDKVLFESVDVADVASDGAEFNESPELLLVSVSFESVEVADVLSDSTGTLERPEMLPVAVELIEIALELFVKRPSFPASSDVPVDVMVSVPFATAAA